MQFQLATTAFIPSSLRAKQNDNNDETDDEMLCKAHFIWKNPPTAVRRAWYGVAKVYHSINSTASSRRDSGVPVTTCCLPQSSSSVRRA